MLASIGWLSAAGCSQGCAQPERPPAMTSPISTSHTELEQAYRAHDPLSAGHQRAEAVAVGDGDAITVLANQNLDGETEHAWLIALDPAGNVRWERHLDAKYGAGRALAALPGGGFAIAGDVRRGAMAYQATLVRTDGKGEVTGATALGPRDVTGFSALAVRPDGSLIAGGASQMKGWLVTADPALAHPGDRMFEVDDIKAVGVLASGDAVALAAIEKSTTGFGRAKLAAITGAGSVAWERALPSSGRGDPAALVVTRDGALAVGTGAADERAPSRVWLARLDAAGAIRWEHTLGDDRAAWRAFAATALGTGFAIVGRTVPPDGVYTAHVWRLADDGTVQWDSDLAIPGGGHADEVVTSVAATHDGGLVIGGQIGRGAGKTNVWVVRLAADGKVAWQKVLGAAATASS
jgi:hypothetical protein